VDYSKRQTRHLFLDEIGDMPVTLQAVLLRFLMIGRSVRSAASNARSISPGAATNANLDESLQGPLRSDSCFAQHARGDVVTAARTFGFAKIARHLIEKIDPSGADRKRIDRLAERNWEGKSRELRNSSQDFAGRAGHLIDETSVDNLLGPACGERHPERVSGSDRTQHSCMRFSVPLC